MASLRNLLGKFQQVTSTEIESGEVNLEASLPGETIILMSHCQSSPGCCDTRGGEYMTWCVPADATSARFLVWGGGGGGAGACCCQQGVPGGSGAFARNDISVTGGDCYELCVGDGAQCTECCRGCQGGTSYVLGAGLNNFCAEGGFGGKTCCFVYWRTPCSLSDCCFWYMNNCDKAQFNGAACGAEGVLGYAFTLCGCNDNNCYWKQALAYPAGIVNKQGGNTILRNMGNACNNEWLMCTAVTGMSTSQGSQQVGLGGPSATSCGGGNCYGYRGGPGMIKISYR